MKMRFLRDEPITRKEQDRLGLSSFLNLIHTSIRATETPFVYGILGDWGTGKTSVMQLLSGALLKDDATTRRFIPIWFNAWLYENEQNQYLGGLALAPQVIEIVR
jgi:predicted KAP-like P-loop ATPase